MKSRFVGWQVTTHWVQRNQLRMPATMWANLAYGVSTVNKRADAQAGSFLRREILVKTSLFLNEKDR